MNKFKSRKLWVTIWAMAVVSFIVIANRPDFIGLATLLASAPLFYMGANTYQKTHLEDKENK